MNITQQAVYRALRRAMEERCLTRVAMCRKAGVSNSSIDNIKLGNHWPRLDTFCLLADGLGMKPSELLALVEEEQEAER